MKKDYTFQKVMETQNDLKDTDGFDWLESTKLAIDKRKFLLYRLFERALKVESVFSCLLTDSFD